MSEPRFRVAIHRATPGERPEQYFAPTREAAETLARQCLKFGDGAEIWELQERLVDEIPAARPDTSTEGTGGAAR